MNTPVQLTEAEKLQSVNSLTATFLEACERALAFTQEPRHNHFFIRQCVAGFRENDMQLFSYLIEDLRKSVKVVMPMDKVDDYIAKLEHKCAILDQGRVTIMMASQSQELRILSGRIPAPPNYFVLIPGTKL